MEKSSSSLVKIKNIVNILFVIMTIILFYMTYKDLDNDFSYIFAIAYIVSLLFVTVFNLYTIIKSVQE